MFNSNCRIENNKSIKFYEQDILLDESVYTNDIEINMDADIVSPGIGIALIKNEGLSVDAYSESYLFRLGYSEANIIYKYNNIENIERQTALSIVKFPNNNIKITFKKVGKKINFSVNNMTVFTYYLKSDIDTYNIALYSNAGNIIKNITMATNIPYGWHVNMANAKSGHINFIKNGFSFENCIGQVELEQTKIYLAAGRYYCKFENKGDIKCFIYNSEDERLYDEDKNILVDGVIDIPEATYVNLKFKGHNGSINNIYITDNINECYNPTSPNDIEIKPSKIIVDLKNVEYLEWSGTIFDVPDEITSPQFGVLNYKNLFIYPLSSKVMLGFEYNYKLYKTKINTYKLEINSGFERTITLTSDTKVNLFYNVSAEISKLNLKQYNEEVIELIANKKSLISIPNNINGPIIVTTTNNNIPLDLSSSFRYNPLLDQYIFTNRERERFEGGINLSHKPSGDINSINVYGILSSAVTNEDKLLYVNNDNLSSIDMYTKNYEQLTSYDYQISGRSVYVSDRRKYKEIIVDYEKDSSYCINYDKDKDSYIVEIAANVDTTVICDYTDENNLIESDPVRITNISPDRTNYIVLRRG